jgi:hypothetical protein
MRMLKKAKKFLKKALLHVALRFSPIKKLHTHRASLLEELSRIRAEEARARELTQVDPLEIPQVPGAFWLKVKVDHESVFRAHSEDYVYQKVKDRLDANAKLISDWVSRIDPFLSSEAIARIPTEAKDATGPYWNNPMFVAGDPRVCYAMVASVRPHRVIEVGSGESTKFIRRAFEDFNVAGELIAIDPFPTAEIRGVANTIIRKSVWDTPLEMFEELQAG